MNFIKGIFIIFGAMILWTLGILILVYVTSYIPNSIIRWVVLGIGILIFVRFSELYSK